MDKSLSVSGIHVGEHAFDPAKLIAELETRGVQNLSFLTIRTKPVAIDEKYYYEWATWCKEHKVYFMFLYTIADTADGGKKSIFTKEIIETIKTLSGGYFLGNQIGEVGSVIGATPKGYHKGGHVGMKQGMEDLADCRDEFLRRMNQYTHADMAVGMPYIVPLEATALIRYTLDAGATLPLLEMLPGDPEFLVSLLRGCANAYDLPSWGTYIAHEWYGGLRQDDPLKYQRLKVAYRYAYLSGSHVVCLESGDEQIKSFGFDYPLEHPFCRAYRDEALRYENSLRETPRPAAEPETRVAFVYGNLDAFTSWQGGCIWEQYDRDEWSYGEAEWSWRILQELRHSRAWQEIENYGEEDLSNAPAYGLYDVIPANTDARHLAKYDTVIFVGWNSMTEEIYANLREYVENGGRVVMTAAHLNTNTKRDGKYLPIYGGSFEALAGCRITGKTRVNTGVKFIRESMDETILYPLVKNGETDPILIGGARDVLTLELHGAVPLAVYHDDFLAPDENALHAVVENKIGKGTFTLIASPLYPGNNAIWPLYDAIVREQVTASHRRCPVHVLSNDKVRFSTFRTETEDAICLLNTDFTNESIVTVKGYGQEVKKTLAPCEIDWVRLTR